MTPEAGVVLNVAVEVIESSGEASSSWRILLD